MFYSVTHCENWVRWSRPAFAVPMLYVSRMSNSCMTIQSDILQVFSKFITKCNLYKFNYGLTKGINAENCNAHMDTFYLFKLTF